MLFAHLQKQILRFFLDNKLFLKNFRLIWHYSFQDEIDTEIEEAIQDDFNFPNILSEVEKKITKIQTLYKNFEKNSVKLNESFSRITYCLKKILGFVFEDVQITIEEKSLYKNWCLKKSQMKYQEADKIRKILIEKSIL